MKKIVVQIIYATYCIHTTETIVTVSFDVYRAEDKSSWFVGNSDTRCHIRIVGLHHIHCRENLISHQLAWY
jgi:hypothetical protein